MCICITGVIRGCGRQMLAAQCNLVNYWFIGIPIAVVLAFHFHLGVAGLWTGLLVATSIQGKQINTTTRMLTMSDHS